MAEQFDPELEIRRHLSMSAPLAWTEAGREWKTADDVAAWKQAVSEKAPWLLEAAARVGVRIERQKEADMVTEEREIKKRSRARKGSAARPEPKKVLADDDAVAAAIAANKAEVEAAAKLEAQAAAKPQPQEVASKKPSLTDLPESELRAKLLATPTLSDSTWAPKLGKPVREEGESRTAYIERVLAAS